MFFNIQVSESTVFIKTSAEDIIKLQHTPLHICRHTVVKPTNATSSKEFGANLLDDEGVFSGAVAVRMLREDPPVILYASPVYKKPGFEEIPDDILWPYARIIKQESTKQTSRYNPIDGWTIGKFKPCVLVWGLRIDYNLPRPEVTGLYFQTNMTDVLEFYPKNALGVGLAEFFRLVKESHVIVTDSRKSEKLHLLIRLACDLGVGIDVQCALFSSLEEALAVHVPGLNWNYPKVVERWLENQRLQSIRYIRNATYVPRVYPKNWYTDFYSTSDMVSTNEAKQEEAKMLQYYKEKIEILFEACLPILAARMDYAIDLGVDLRCTLRPDEFMHAYNILRGNGIEKTDTRYYGKAIMDSFQRNSAYKYLLIALSEKDADGNSVNYYVYDLIAYINSIIETTLTGENSLLKAEYLVRGGQYSTFITSNSDIEAVYDYGVITSVNKQNLQPLFAFDSMFVSQRGLFGLDENSDRYGYGHLGTEGARTLAVSRMLAAKRHDATQNPSFVTRSDTSYTILVMPQESRTYGMCLTAEQNDALESDLIPIPIEVWKNPDSENTYVYTSTYKEDLHRRYNGDFWNSPPPPKKR